MHGLSPFPRVCSHLCDCTAGTAGMPQGRKLAEEQLYRSTQSSPAQHCQPSAHRSVLQGLPGHCCRPFAFPPALMQTSPVPLPHFPFRNQSNISKLPSLINQRPLKMGNTKTRVKTSLSCIRQSKRKMLELKCYSLIQDAGSKLR